MTQMCPGCSQDNPDGATACWACGEPLRGLLAGNTLLENRYRLVRVLGCGGMGAVYLAEDNHVGQHQVAIKENRNTSAQAHALFESEKDLMVGLRHRALPEVSDYFVGPAGRQYLVMDYIAGETLEDHVMHNPRLRESEIIGLADQLLAVMEYLHGHGVIHRDVKPPNVKLTPGGRIVLVDFGIARECGPASQTKTWLRGIGSPGFAAAEQYGGGTDERSDLYSVGAVLYYLVTGNVPPEAPMLACGTPLPPPHKLRPDTSLELQRLIFKAMAPDRALRFQSAQEMRRGLLAIPGAAAALSPSGVPPTPGLPQAGLTPPPGSSGGASSGSPPVGGNATSQPTPHVPWPWVALGACAIVAGFMLWGSGRAPGRTSAATPTAASLAMASATSLSGAAAGTPSPAAVTVAATSSASGAGAASAAPATPALTPSLTPSLTATRPPTRTPSRTPTPQPSRTPTSPPTPVPLAVASNVRDFSSSQGSGGWQYQVEQGRNSGNFSNMPTFGNYQGSSCWLTPQESYVRICAEGEVHPGATGRIALRWKSDQARSVRVDVHAHKIDTRCGNNDGVWIGIFQVPAGRPPNKVSDFSIAGLDNRDRPAGIHSYTMALGSSDEVLIMVDIASSPNCDRTRLYVDVYPAS